MFSRLGGNGTAAALVVACFLLNGPTKGQAQKPIVAVAYLYDGQVVLTRAEFDEYLKHRRGGDELLEFFINRQIIEIECGKHNILVTDAEVDKAVEADLALANVSAVEFEKILPRFRHTLYTWREDVIRPKLMMQKLLRAKIKISEKDLQVAFEARYGPKVECRMIVFHDPAGQEIGQRSDVQNAMRGREQFLIEASKQSHSGLAWSQGRMPAVHRHFGEEKLEQMAFRLKEGEISSLVQLKTGEHVLLLCEKHHPANKAAMFKEVREDLYREVLESRVAESMHSEFAELRKKAAPKVVNSKQP